MNPHIEAKNIEFAYHGGKPIFKDLSVTFPKGKITTLIGPNGCGKSTLLGVLSKENQVTAGTILFDGEPLNKIKRRAFAQKTAMLHQHNNEELNITVKELVACGRTPYQGFRQPADTKSEEIVNWAMKCAGVDEIQDKIVSQLSGGQRQRTWLAMSLCQQPEVLLLDEPTTYLDIYYQLELLNLVKQLNKEYGMTIIMVLHDINQALNYSDHIVVMKEGKIIKEGTPESIAQETLIQEVYGVQSKIYKKDNYLIDFY